VLLGQGNIQHSTLDIEHPTPATTVVSFVLSVFSEPVPLAFARTNCFHPPMPANTVATTPEPPYYAVIFTSQRTAGERGYGAMADRMLELAAQQPGYLGVESVRDAEGFGITVSYWTSEEAIRAWKANTEHQVAQQAGMKTWYGDYALRVAKVERAYGRKA